MILFSVWLTTSSFGEKDANHACERVKLAQAPENVPWLDVQDAE